MMKTVDSPPSKIPRLNQKSVLPLHVQAERMLRELIQQPEIRSGGLLPDEVSLSSLLGISRNTLRAAIGRLVSEGRLERKAGVGTRATEPKVYTGAGAWHSFTREMEGKGIKVETYSLKQSWVRVSNEIALALRVDGNSQVLRLDRVRGWDGRPEVFFRSYLHPRLKLPVETNFCGPLYDLIRERCHVQADHSQEELCAVAANRFLGRMLAVEVGTPLLRRDRVVFDTGNRPVEVSVVHYRSDRFKLTLNLREE